MGAQLHLRGIEVRHQPTKTQRALELAVFLLASLVGIYGIGKGLAGFYERGQEINLLWLAVTGLAFFVLSAQMGRVHDSWPHRPDNTALEAPTAHGSPNAESPGAETDLETDMHTMRTEGVDRK